MADGLIHFLSEDPHSPLDASGIVGDWVHDAPSSRIALSRGSAARLGLEEEASAHGVPLAVFLDRLRPQDRPLVEAALAAAGGIVEMRFETGPSDGGGGRSLVMRGRIETDGAGGPASGSGVVIDVTEERDAERLHEQRRINRLADHAIAMRGMVEGMQRPRLGDLIDEMLTEIAFEIARLLRAEHEQSQA